MIKRTPVLLLLLLGGPGCGASSEDPAAGQAAVQSSVAPAEQKEAEHEHAETPLGTIQIDGLAVELAQGHGGVKPGEEAHLVVKLPYTDQGSTQVRAWIGTDDRTLSRVGRGEYAASHDDYDVHAVAPDPLPADVRWWIELQRPDGTRALGSVEPLFD